MKRFALFLLVFSVLAAGQVFAQDANLITLNDTNPSVSALVDLPADATGVVTVDLSMAAVTLTDASGQVVFSSGDARVHHLELSIAPNSGSHTLTIQRLPGATLASAQIGSQPDLTPISPVTLVDSNAISLEQQHALSLDMTHPAGQVSLDIQPNTTGLVTARFPGALVSSQLTDASGMLIASSAQGIDGFNMVLDGGRYDLSAQAHQTDTSITAGVSVTPTDRFTLLSAPQAPAETTQTLVSSRCTATVATSSVNLRSGPGTGYSVLSAGVQGDAFTVGGINPERNWVVVGTNSGSGWLARDLAQLDGECSQLTVFNIPLRNAQAAPVIVQVVPGSSGSSGYYEDDDDHEEDEYHGEDHDEQHESEDEHESEDD